MLNKLFSTGNNTASSVQPDPTVSEEQPVVSPASPRVMRKIIEYLGSVIEVVATLDVSKVDFNIVKDLNSDRINRTRVWTGPPPPFGPIPSSGKVLRVETDCFHTVVISIDGKVITKIESAETKRLSELVTNCLSAAKSHIEKKGEYSGAQVLEQLGFEPG